MSTKIDWDTVWKQFNGWYSRTERNPQAYLSWEAQQKALQRIVEKQVAQLERAYVCDGHTNSGPCPNKPSYCGMCAENIGW